MSESAANPRVTLRTLRKLSAAGQKFPVLTVYDATTASWLWKGGLKVMLVGDTAGQMILGYDSTLPVPVTFMVQLTGAVRRGAKDALVIADMPFGSYQCGDDDAMKNAVAFMTDGAADAVKLEVAPGHAPLVQRMTDAGIPVVAHIGSRPQQVRAMGGFHSTGRTKADAQAIVESARRMVDHGAAMLLIEAVPAEVSQRIVDSIDAVKTGRVPIIGCGGGPACHGHVIVLHDLLGLTTWQPPFAPPVANLGDVLVNATKAWVSKVESGEYLKLDHPYRAE